MLTIISLLNNLKMIRWLLNACQLHVLFLTRYTGNSRGDFLSFYLRFHRFHICHNEALKHEAMSGIPTWRSHVTGEPMEALRTFGLYEES